VIRAYIRQAYRFLWPLLYGRSRFKLFLKTTLEDVDLRVQQLACTVDFFSSVLRPVRIRAPFGKSMLVIAPHQDDEAIGCGGAMALQAQSGNDAFTVVIFDGGSEHMAYGLERHELTQLRNEESRRAAVCLGVSEPRFLALSDPRTGAAEASRELLRIIEEANVDAVFTPFVLEASEHRQANYIVAEALKRVRREIRVFGYEVWGFVIPNVAVVIDDVMDRKIQALDCFETANRALNYTWSTQGVNMYRTRLLEAGSAKYAECFFELPRSEFVHIVERIQAAEGRSPRNSLES
jgi:N-acetylglucosamine malate deacetylase 1